MNWEELKIFLKGKVFLIGITFLDKDNLLIEKYETSGIVQELTDKGIFKFLRSDKSIFQLPYDKESIIAAKPGDYRETGTKKIINNPDYVTTWTYIVKDIEHLNSIKNTGYVV